MIYVALLRGVNVGGKNRVDMKLLKETFIRLGMETVITYINSGNVIFTDKKRTKEEITTLLEECILQDFNLNIKVLVRNINDFDNMMKILPDSWKNDKEMRSDVLFLFEEMDSDKVLSKLKIQLQIDTVMYVPGAILWAIDKNNITKSGLQKLVGTALYKNMTVRNVNTTRNIYEIMKELHKQ